MDDDLNPEIPDDDITVKGIFTCTPTDVKGPSFVYAEIREIEDFIEYNRRDLPAYGTSDALIDDIKQTIKDRGYVFDTDEVYRSAIAFPVGVDINGNIQIAEGNHRLTAALEVAKETGKNIRERVKSLEKGRKTFIGTLPKDLQGK